MNIFVLNWACLIRRRSQAGHCMKFSTFRKFGSTLWRLPACRQTLTKKNTKTDRRREDIFCNDLPAEKVNENYHNGDVPGYDQHSTIR